MNAKHTPGPWSLYARDPLIIVNAAGSSLGEASSGDPFISANEQLANAHLIAAAPELLDALQLSVQAMRAPLDDWKGELERKALDAANSAIAKAEAVQ